jgi:hypothetical protein
VKGVPVRVRVLETLKGVPPPNGEMVAVGFEFACDPTFREGDRRILLLSKSQANFVHLCAERPAEASKIQEYEGRVGEAVTHNKSLERTVNYRGRIVLAKNCVLADAQMAAVAGRSIQSLDVTTWAQRNFEYGTRRSISLTE